MPCHQDPGHNGQHAFATFIHSVGSAALSRAPVIFAFYSLYSLAPDSPLRQYLKRRTPAPGRSRGEGILRGEKTRARPLVAEPASYAEAQLTWNESAGDQPGLRASRPRG